MQPQMFRRAFALYDNLSEDDPVGLTWVLNIAFIIEDTKTKAHFERNESRTPYLKEDSPIRKYGKRLGLPAVYFDWLCAEDKVQKQELGMLLTPEFFRMEIIKIERYGLIGIADWLPSARKRPQRPVR